MSHDSHERRRRTPSKLRPSGPNACTHRGDEPDPDRPFVDIQWTRGKKIGASAIALAAAALIVVPTLGEPKTNAAPFSTLECSDETQTLAVATGEAPSVALSRQVEGVASWADIVKVPVTIPSGTTLPFEHFRIDGPPAGSRVPVECEPDS